MTMRSILPFLLLAGLGFATCTEFAWAYDYPSYENYEVYPIGGNNSEAMAVNGNGEVVGRYWTYGGSNRGIAWLHSGNYDLGCLPGDVGSVALGINDSGQVVGYSYDDKKKPHAFIWTVGSGMQSLGDLPGGFNYSEARAISGNGRVVGYANTDRGNEAFTWTRSGGMVRLAYLPGSDSYGSVSEAFALNSWGDVVGINYAYPNNQAVLWPAGGSPRGLGDIGGGPFDSRAQGINDAGDIVGYGFSDYGKEAFYRTAQGQMLSLGTLLGATYHDTVAYDINNRGQVVGETKDGFSTVAFLWNARDRMKSLNSILNKVDNRVVQFIRATAINDKGEMVGSMWYNGVQRAFLVKVFPPPVATPTFSPVGGTYPTPQTVSIACSTAGASIRYTTNGSDPSGASAVYNGPININTTMTVKARAFKSGMNNSSVATAAYTIAPPVATPTFNPAGGIYASAQTVTITCSTAGAAIRYTTDGSDPTGSSTLYGSPITVSTTKTLKARAFKSGMTNSPVASATYTIAPPVATPTFSPAGGIYPAAQTVVIACSTTGATIRYTTDGSDPTASSQVYSAAISVSTTKTVKARAFKSGMTTSPVASATYTIGTPAAKPAFSPPGGTYRTAQAVSITCSTTGATIRYTKDGSEPTSASTVYSGPIQLSTTAVATVTLKARAFKPGLLDSAVASATYTIDIRVAKPTFTPKSGTYDTAQSVAIACGTTGATIRYTADGTVPTSSSAVYSTPVKVSTTTTLNARAFKTGMPDSAVATATFTIAPRIATPTFSPAAGVYTTAQTVTIACSTAGASIYYTIDGSEPTSHWLRLYKGPFPVNANTTVKAKAYKTGMTDSFVASATYTIAPPVAKPAFNPEGGTFTGAQTVAMTCATVGATIRYTTDGSSPTSASTLYTGPIQVVKTTTLRARAFKSGMTNSPAHTATYTIMFPVAKPTFSPGGGTFTSPPTVTMACSTGGATIRYTTDGSDPSAASSAYTTGIRLSKTTTLKAKAFKSGMTDSAVASATYTMAPQAAKPSFSPEGGTYTGAQTVAMASTTVGATIRYTLDGSSPTSASTLYSTPIKISTTTTLRARAFKTGMTNSPDHSATYIIKPPVAKPTFSPPGGTYTSPPTVTIACSAVGATIRYTTDGSSPTSASTLYSAPIRVSKTTTLKARAFKAGMTDSSVASATYTMAPQVAKPTFNPEGGTYTRAQTVAMASSTVGATIRYTTDGSSPTSASTLYSGPIQVSKTTTLRARAFKSGMTNSPEHAATYTIGM